MTLCAAGVSKKAYWVSTVRRVYMIFRAVALFRLQTIIDGIEKRVSPSQSRPRCS